jgi:hypothetical protein
MSLRKKPPPIPEASRLDRMTETDLYLALEADLINANRVMSVYQQQPSDREPSLAQLQSHLENATAEVKALRRKLVVILPNS